MEPTLHAVHLGGGGGHLISGIHARRALCDAGSSVLTGDDATEHFENSRFYSTTRVKEEARSDPSRDLACAGGGVESLSSLIGCGTWTQPNPTKAGGNPVQVLKFH